MRWRFGERNEVGEDILEFAEAYGTDIVNAFFKKRKERIITFNSGRNRS